MRKKKTWIILLSCLVVLFVGGKWVYNTVIHTAANQISAELAKPEVEEAINQLKEQYASNIDQYLLNEDQNASSKEQNVSSDEQSASSDKQSASNNSKAKKESSSKENNENTEFKSQEDALKFVVSRVSVSDLKYVKEITSEGLTEENKEKLQEMALEKFTAEEIEAVLKALQ